MPRSVRRDNLSRYPLTSATSWQSSLLLAFEGRLACRMQGVVMALDRLLTSVVLIIIFVGVAGMALVWWASRDAARCSGLGGEYVAGHCMKKGPGEIEIPLALD